MASFGDSNEQIIAEFRANGGKVGGDYEGGDLLVLHTTGARTGRERLTPLNYLAANERLYVFAMGSVVGTTRKHPAWYHNLVVRPEVTVEVGAETIGARASLVQGAEREEIWGIVAERIPDILGYEDTPGQDVPVIALDAQARDEQTG